MTTKMLTAISFLTDFLSYHTQEETLRRTLFLHTIFPCKGMKRQSNTNDRLKYRHKKVRQPSTDYCHNLGIPDFLLDIPWFMSFVPLPDIPARKMAKTV